MVRPSRKNRSVKSSINRVKREAEGVYNKIAEISAKTGIQSGRFYGIEGDPYHEGFERVPLDEQDEQMVVFKAKAGIGPNMDLAGSYRKPKSKRAGGKTRKGAARKPLVVAKRTMNPPKGAQIVGRTKVDTHKGTKFYHNKKGQIVEKKSGGKTSQKDPVLKMLNDLRAAGMDYEITRIYSEKSRKLRGTNNMLAMEVVKPNYVGVPTKYQAWGYYTADGKAKIMFEGGGNSLLGALAGLDNSAVMRPGEIPLKQYYEEMSLGAQAKVAEMLKDIDWDEIFDDVIYDSRDEDAGVDIKGAYDSRDMIRSLMDEIVTSI